MVGLLPSNSALALQRGGDLAVLEVDRQQLDRRQGEQAEENGHDQEADKSYALLIPPHRITPFTGRV